MNYFIFDFDGVLADTFEPIVKNSVMRGETKDEEEARTRITAYFSREPEHSRKAAPTPERLKEMYDWNVMAGTHLLERGFSMFDDFIEKVKTVPNLRAAVVSSGSQNYVIPRALGTGIPFTHILGFEDHHSKEEKIELICRDWGIEPTQIYYFTDALVDVYELRDLLGAGRVIGCAWGFCGYDILRKELPDMQILKEPSDIERVIV